MKKNIFLAIASVALLLASCKNEDISISREISFQVNPYTVVSEFAKYEVNTGDVQSLPDVCRLRTHLLVYDKDGNLVKSEQSNLQDYLAKMNVNVELSDGNYTAVAITYVVVVSGETAGVEFWSVSGTDRLANLTVTKNAEVWAYQYGILGIQTEQVAVGTGKNTITIDVKPAGAFVVNWIYNLHQYDSEVQYYQPFMTKESTSCTFGSDGNYTANYNQSTDYIYPIMEQVWPQYYEFVTVYTYSFFLPFGQTAFRWEALLTDNQYVSLFNEPTGNIQQGKCYQFAMDLSSQQVVFEELANTKSDMAHAGAQAVNLGDASIGKRVATTK